MVGVFFLLFFHQKIWLFEKKVYFTIINNYPIL